MKNIKLDILKNEYIDSLIELENLCFSIPWTKQMFAQDVSKTDAYYVVALDGQKVVGYCGLYKVLDQADITNIAVHPDYRKKGLASLMLDNIIKYCTNCTLSFITLEVRQSNQSAINLYKKYGFNEVGLRKNYYADNHENAILMTKYIKEVH